MEKKYFHEIDQKEVAGLIASKKSWGYISANYKQPDWCAHCDALMGVWGCWSLTDREKNGRRTEISKEYCRNCDYFKSEFK